MRNAAKTIIAVSILGAANAMYLTYLFIQSKLSAPAESFCDINESVSCGNVITSKYALFFGVPVCTIALFVYPALAALGFLALKRTATRNLFFVISILAAMGLMLNVVYIHNEVVYIKSICALCVGCTVLIAIALASGIRGYSTSAN